MNQHVSPADEERALLEQRSEIVRLVDVRRSFSGTPALNGISLSVRQGEILGIIGRSGAGKLTLIRCLNGLERPDSGQVFIEDRETGRLSESELQPLRRRIGMVFQHFNLLAAKTVEENVALPLKIAGVARTARMKRTAELLELVGLSEKARMYPAALSGGQKQRVGIARALAARPALLLSDEATSALDPETTKSILELLKTINRDLGLTIVLITHEMQVIRSIADRVAVIDAGRIVEEGPVWSVFADPQSEITRRLLGDTRPDLPGDFLASLSQTPVGEAIIRIDAAGDTAHGPLLADLATEVTQRFRIVHGGVDTIQGKLVARLFLGLPGKQSLVHNAIEFLVAKGAKAELLGYVESDA